MNRRVTVVLDPELGDKVAELRATEPVWVVSSPTNLAAWNTSESKDPNSAVFRASNVEARWDNLKSQLVDIDQQFGLDSYPEDPYVGVRVLGLALDVEIEEGLRLFGFAEFMQTKAGFDADLSLSARLRC